MNRNIFFSKVRVYSEKNKQMFTIDPTKMAKFNLGKLIEYSETKVHDGFDGVISEVQSTELTFEKIRTEEKNPDAKFLFLNGHAQKILKYHGHTIWVA